MEDISDKIRRTVFSVVRRYNFQTSDRADILQDIWLSVTQAFYVGYHEEGTITAWVWKISRNTCVDFCRTRQSSRNHLHAYQYYYNTVASDENNPRLLQRAILDKYIKKIRAEHSHSLEHKVLEDVFLKYKNKSQTSKDLGISRKVVNRILKKIFKKMKQEYDRINDNLIDSI